MLEISINNVLIYPLWDIEGNQTKKIIKKLHSLIENYFQKTLKLRISHSMKAGFNWNHRGFGSTTQSIY